MTDTATGLTLRDATPADVSFLAWVMHAAARSHLERGIWEYLNDQSEDETLAFLREVAVTDVVHLCHQSLFVIAEVGGEPAAAMCAYDSATQGYPAFGQVLPAAAARAGVRMDGPDYARRSAVLMSGFQHHVEVEVPPVVWTIENVATKAAFRRRGLVDVLLRELLDRGRERGYEAASIGVFLGNEPARAAYVKAGFELISECRSEGWAAEIGCPGTELLLQRL